MDREEIDKYLDILDGDDRPDSDKFDTARRFVDGLLAALQDAEGALETYQLVHSSETYHYYVTYSWEEGFGCTQVEMNRPISGGMDILDLVKLARKESGSSEVIIQNWIELDHL